MYYNTNFENEDKLRKAIDDYIFFYNNDRYQERFNNLTPTEIRQVAMNSTVPVQYPIPENKRILAYKAMLAEKRKNRIENFIYFFVYLTGVCSLFRSPFFILNTYLYIILICLLP